MRRLLLVAGAALLLLAAPASGNVAGSTRLQVVAREFTFVASRKSVNAGKTVIELANFGADPHNLRIRTAAGKLVPGGLDSILGGKRAELTVKLKPGQYVLFCSLANHESLGMKATLDVKEKN